MKKCIFILVLAAAVLVSCTDEPGGNFNRAEFNRERQLWLEQDVQNYYFYLYKSNYPGGGPISASLYIKDGVLAYIQDDWDDVPVPVEEKYYIPSFFFGITISDVYAEIERFANDAGRSDSVEIQYDREWHYPKYFKREKNTDNLFKDSSYVSVSIEKFVADPEMPSGQ